MKRIVALSSALLLAFAVSVRPAEAGHTLPITVVDRTAITLTYMPAGAGTSTFAVGASWRLDRTWDVLLGYNSTSGPGAGNAFRIGGRYHLRPPAPAYDVYATVQYVSETTGAAAAVTGFLLGAGLSQDLAPTLTGYSNVTYHSQLQTIMWDFGVQYQLSKAISLVGGVNSGAGYLGLSYNIGAR